MLGTHCFLSRALSWFHGLRSFALRVLSLISRASRAARAHSLRVARTRCCTRTLGAVVCAHATGHERSFISQLRFSSLKRILVARLRADRRAHARVAARGTSLPLRAHAHGFWLARVAGCTLHVCACGFIVCRTVCYALPGLPRGILHGRAHARTRVWVLRTLRCAHASILRARLPFFLRLPHALVFTLSFARCASTRTRTFAVYAFAHTLSLAHWLVCTNVALPAGRHCPMPLRFTFATRSLPCLLPARLVRGLLPLLVFMVGWTRDTSFGFLSLPPRYSSFHCAAHTALRGCRAGCHARRICLYILCGLRAALIVAHAHHFASRTRGTYLFLHALPGSLTTRGFARVRARASFAVWNIIILRAGRGLHARRFCAFLVWFLLLWFHLSGFMFSQDFSWFIWLLVLWFSLALNARLVYRRGLLSCAFLRFIFSFQAQDVRARCAQHSSLWRMDGLSRIAVCCLDARARARALASRALVCARRVARTRTHGTSHLLFWLRWTRTDKPKLRQASGQGRGLKLI